MPKMTLPQAPGRPRVPPEIKVELFSTASGFLPRITQIVKKEGGDDDGDPGVWLKNLTDYLAGGEAMIVNARIGRTLVGFVVLDSTNLTAPFSWVHEAYRNKGLGERFYSFACINLGVPAPEFRFPKDQLAEFGHVLKTVGTEPTLRDSLYVVHERPTEEAA